MKLKDIQQRLIDLLSLTPKDICNQLATNLYSNPIRYKTKFTQKLITIRNVDNASTEQASVENNEARTFYGKDQIINIFLDSRFINILFKNTDIKIPSSHVRDHLTYGICVKEGEFISGLEIILAHIKNLLIAYLCEDINFKQILIDLLQKAVGDIKYIYTKHCFVFRPVFTVPSEHQNYQALNKSIRSILIDDKDTVYIVRLILEAYIFSNPSYQNKVDWLYKQSWFLADLVAKYNYFKFLQIHNSTYTATSNNSSSYLALVNQYDKTITDVKVVKWRTTEFVEYNAAFVANSQEHQLKDIGNLHNLVIGKIIKECQKLGIDSPDHPKFEEFMTTVYSLIDDRLSLKQMYHN